MEIGLFQLENLVLSQVRFCFLDLREKSTALPAQIEVLLSRAQRLNLGEVETHLEKTMVNREAPVILLSETGREAKALRSTLEASGYTNIYVVEGGVVGLLSEL